MILPEGIESPFIQSRSRVSVNLDICILATAGAVGYIAPKGADILHLRCSDIVSGGTVILPACAGSDGGEMDACGNCI